MPPDVMGCESSSLSQHYFSLNDRYELRSRSVLMLSFLHFLDDLGRKSIKIAGIARSDDAAVGDHGRIFPFGAGVDDIGLDRVVRRHLAALRNANFHEQPGRMADRGYSLPGVED